MQLELIRQLARVAAQEDELGRARLRLDRLWLRHVEPGAQPCRGLRQVLEQESEALGDRVVPEVTILHRQPARHVREVLGVTGLVEQRLVVVAAASARDH